MTPEKMEMWRLSCAMALSLSRFWAMPRPVRAFLADPTEEDRENICRATKDIAWTPGEPRKPKDVAIHAMHTAIRKAPGDMAAAQEIMWLVDELDMS